MIERNEQIGLAAVLRKRYWRGEDAKLVLAAWVRSGEKLSEFARRHDVDPGRLSRWHSRLGKRRRPAVRFHRVEIASVQTGMSGASEEAALEVFVGGGRRIVIRRGFDPQVLRGVLQVLDGPSC